MVYGTYNYSYWGESKPTYNWGGHIVWYSIMEQANTVLSEWQQINNSFQTQ